MKGERGGGAASPCHPTRTLKAASSGEHHTELGADFCLLLLPRSVSMSTLALSVPQSLSGKCGDG